jgi:hypothetical protein
MSKISWEQALSSYLSDETQSYQTIAKKYGVSKRAVVKHAEAAKWQDIKAKTALKVHQKLPNLIGQEIAQINARHIKIARILQGEAIKALGDPKIALKSFRDILDTMKLGVEIERKATNMDQQQPTTAIQINMSDEVKKWAI